MKGFVCGILKVGSNITVDILYGCTYRNWGNDIYIFYQQVRHFKSLFYTFVVKLKMMMCNLMHFLLFSKNDSSALYYCFGDVLL